ncbi:MAG: hypothetical protein Tsb0014_12930 [Pleurocapsa sp.]
MDNTLPNDPLFSLQWHLNSVGQSGGTIGEDINVLGAWQIATGDDVVIGIVDDGLQYTHPDLKNQYLASLSYDFAKNDSDPAPLSSQFHGTAVAGIAAAEGNNEIGISGVAYNADLAGLKIVTTQLNQNALDAQLAAALSYKNQDIDIYNNSWELSQPLIPLGESTANAIKNGIKDGRDGLGSIYVFGAGNDGATEGNVNYNAFANSRYTIAVGEIDANGVKTSSSNPGASLLISAYGGDGIVTTDLLGEKGLNLDLSESTLDNDYTQLSGTSAATPIVSGVVALMLEANPNLTWRDVQHILVGTAKRNDPDHSDWIYNGAGFFVNHDYGFGAIDAEAAVEAAADWQPLPWQSRVSYATEEESFSGLISSRVSNPATPLGTTDYFSIPEEEDINLEWVEVDISPYAYSRSTADALDPDVELILTSPSGTKSILSQNPSSVSNSAANNWTFTTARHWGESSEGRWTLTATHSDSTTEEKIDIDFNWQLKFYGTEDPIIPIPMLEIEEGIRNGRGGLGDIYIYGVGDDGETGGNVNYNALANSRYTIAVGEINDKGVKTTSSNPGASLLVTADGKDNLTGTSAAADTVSNVVDSMLKANPNLTWRDVQHILVGTAKRNDPDHSDWIYNGAGFFVNHNYGFGTVDAEAVVEAAADWQPLPWQSRVSYATEEESFSGLISSRVSNPATPLGTTDYFFIPEEENFYIEWVEVVITPPTLSSSAPDALDLDVELILTSPSGTKSILSQNPSSVFDSAANNWTLTTARHWGESSEGRWTLTATHSDSTTEEKIDIDFNWQLKFYGTDEPITPIDRIANGIENGRGGLGDIHIYGAGDDGENGGNVNYDPLVNSRYTIAVGEIDDKGVKTISSNIGASLLVAANGKDNLTGTSAAADLVSDVTDLMLEVNPNLTWRDIQYILVGTAKQNDPNHPDWINNGAGDLVNHNYGFGAIDAEAAIVNADNWQSLKSGVSYATEEESFSGLISSRVSNPATPLGTTDYFSIPEEENFYIEWVEVVITPSTLSSSNPDALDPDVELILTSPSGTKSILSQNPSGVFDIANNSWTLTTARHWGESSKGRWTLTATHADSTTEEKIDIDFNWQLKFYGADSPTSLNSIDFIAPNTPGVDLCDILPNCDDIFGILDNDYSDREIDLVWRNSQNGRTSIWSMDGTTQKDKTVLEVFPDSNWLLQAVADFNDDGNKDLVWRNSQNGSNTIWYMEGATKSDRATLDLLTDLNWNIEDTGDFNNDGNEDLIWRNLQNGRTSIWYMDDATKIGRASLAEFPNSNWDLGGVGDFNDDGNEDLIWRNLQDGRINIWYMNDATKIGRASLQEFPDLNWDLEGVRDFNDDGNPDLLWRSYNTGENRVWLMDGATKVNRASLDSVRDPDYMAII